jgi:hypothetical protein
MSIERLREIAESDLGDSFELRRAVRDIAAHLAGTGKPRTMSAASFGGRKPGMPIPEDTKTTQCKRCGEDVVVFKSKSSGRPYLCDMEMGEYENKRQFLTASNWLHQCKGAR